MAESNITVKDYKFPLSLGEETIYKIGHSLWY